MDEHEHEDLHGTALIEFHDGPADDRSFTLHRWPMFLRVVVDDDGTVDVLDLLEDEPKPTETISVYKRGQYGHARGFGWFGHYHFEKDFPVDGCGDPAVWRKQVALAAGVAEGAAD